MTLTVAPLLNRRDRADFIRFPFRLYKGDPCWIPPLILDMKEKLDKRRHPFFTHGDGAFFLARRNGRVTGRIAALLDREHNRYHSEKAASFGLFDFDRDPEVAGALLEKAASFAAERGMKMLRGPLNYSTNEECGSLVEGFDFPPAIMMPYNPPWQEGIFESLGLMKARDLLAYIIDENTPFDRLRRLADRSAKRYDLHVRPVDLKRFREEQQLILEIYNAAWKDNWGYVPMDAAEFGWHARKMKMVLVPDLALVVEARGRTAGFIISLPDFNQVMKRMKGRLFPFGLIKFLYHRRHITGIRVMAMGIRPEFRNQGAEAAMIHETITAGMRLGYKWAELSWVLEDNEPMTRLAEKIGARAYKRYRIWEAPVERLIS